MSQPKCKHVPDLFTLIPADRKCPGLYDVQCSKCGECGSVQIHIKDVQFEEDNEEEDQPAMGKGKLPVHETLWEFA